MAIATSKELVPTGGVSGHDSGAQIQRKCVGHDPVSVSPHNCNIRANSSPDHFRGVHPLICHQRQNIKYVDSLLLLPPSPYLPSF